jgi:YHS domain-containing protein
MPTTDALKTRLDAEFAAAQEQVRRKGEESARANETARQRFETFAQVRDKIRELAEPRLQQLRERFPDGKMEPVRSAQGGSVTLRLDSGLARMTLSFGLSHDGMVTKVFLDYDLEVIPVFVAFDPHDRLEIALEAPDYEQIARWMDNRVVAFAQTYLAVQFAKQYEGENIVEDPVARISFPKVLAQSSLAYQGKTYHFVSAKTRQAFEKDPASYLEPPAATPGKAPRSSARQPAAADNAAP